MGRRCDFRNALLVLCTIPTAAPMPAGWGAASAAAEPPQGMAPALEGGHRDGSTVVAASEHIHPEAFASGEAGGGSTAHAAAAQCLQHDGGAARDHAGAPAHHPLLLLPSELLARLDSVVSMARLSPADALRVVELQLEECGRALEQQGVRLQVEPAAQRWLAERSVSPAAGARRLQPLLRQQLLLPVAEALLRQRLAGAVAGEQQPGSVLGIAKVGVAADESRLHIVFA